MADTGWVLAGTGTNDAGSGATAWSNPSRVTANDNSEADAANIPKNDGLSQLLFSTNYNFSAIPVGATIDGVEFRFERRSVRASGAWNSSINDNLVQLIVGGSLAGSNLSAGANYPNGATLSGSYGGASNLWGASLTRANVVASDFGVAIQAVNNSGAAANYTAYVDYMEMKVYYTEPAPTGNAGAMFMLWRMKDRIREILEPKKRFWLPEPAFARAA